ncbi:MAG: DUF465 domain-containing protein [Gammaproteobacteria bacterium]|nr:DUF465 domain-containing protein [Gammaproteobacteria bacterium]MCW8911485.1 DUF465 domain-containing protein [Gammaproteobacteria bacterium]MCW9004998.1 DUF465 domain-containing protein [Gammaproteobacteria bacterium]MCW9055586.1 DUF465 domain-containing protein [Gammaproteobacteria bacterium]
MSVNDQDQLKDELDELQLEHRDLDDVIRRLYESNNFEQLQMQRLKRRKLKLKDQIARLENQLIPDILA